MNLWTRVGSLVVMTVALSGHAAAQAPRTPEPAAAVPIEQLARDFRSKQDPSLGLLAARRLVAAGRFLEAAALYRDVSELVLPEGAPASASDAKARSLVERQELLPRIPALRITFESDQPEAVQIFVNGVLMNQNEIDAWRPVDPGTVRVHALQGAARVDAVVVVGEGEAKPVRLVFERKLAPVPAQPRRREPAPPEPVEPASPSPASEGIGARRFVAFMAMGVGGAAVLTGGVFGVMALRDEASLQSRCERNRCPSDLQAEVDAYESKKIISVVGLAAGAALAAGGAVLYLSFDERAPARSRIGAFSDGSRVGIRGAF